MILHCTSIHIWWSVACSTLVLVACIESVKQLASFWHLIRAMSIVKHDFFLAMPLAQPNVHVGKGNVVHQLIGE